MSRVTQHAKTLTWQDRQVLAWLKRNDDNALCINLQLWIAFSDEQLQARIECESDEAVEYVFDSLDDATIAQTLDQIGIPELIAKYENIHD